MTSSALQKATVANSSSISPLPLNKPVQTMSELSAAARKRELRSEKILKNAELRKQKIFGIGLGVPVEKNDESVSTADLITTDSEYCSNENCNEFNTSEISNVWKSRISKEKVLPENNLNDSESLSEVEKINNYLRSIPDPMTEEDFFEVSNKSNLSDILPGILDGNFSNFSSESISSTRSSLIANNGERKTSSVLEKALLHLDSSSGPCVMAVLISLQISFNFFNIGSFNLLVPFLVMELQQYMFTIGSFKNCMDNKNFLKSTLLLFGIKKDIVLKCNFILCMMKYIIEDLTIYLFTILMWHATIGFPEKLDTN